MPGCDAGLAEKDLTPVSVDAEIGDRSLAHIAAEACKVAGVAPTPELFEASEDAAEADGEASATKATPDQAADPPTAAEMLKVDGGEADGPAPYAGLNQPPDSKHDPPSG